MILRHSKLPAQAPDPEMYMYNDDMSDILKSCITQEILLFNMREEPVLFVERDGDFIPYTIKTRHYLNHCVVTGKLVKEADFFEANIRKEVWQTMFITLH